MIGGVRWVVLFCRDVEACGAWYEKVGFEPMGEHNGLSFFHLGDGHLLLHPADESSPHGAEIHVNVDDVHEVFRRVVATGSEVFDHQDPGATLNGPVTRSWGDVEFETRDPEGHFWAFTQKT